MLKNNAKKLDKKKNFHYKVPEILSGDPRTKGKRIKPKKSLDSKHVVKNIYVFFPIIKT